MSRSSHSPVSQLQVTSMLHRGVQQFPNNVCTIDFATGRQKSYLDIFVRIGLLSSALRKLGLTPEGPVALLMLNSDLYFESFFTASFAGGLVVPLNIRLSPAEIVEILNDCAAQFVILDETFKPFAKTIISNVKTVKKIIFTESQTKETLSQLFNSSPQTGNKQLKPLSLEQFVASTVIYEDLIKSSLPQSAKQPNLDQLAKALAKTDAARGGDDTFGLFYTGGTTGAPKGVMLTHSNIVINAQGHVAALQYNEKSVYLHSAPMFHLADGASTFGVTLQGGSHVFLQKFEPLLVLEAIEKYKVSKGMMVPVMLTMLLQADSSSKAKKYNCDSLEHLLYGAAPMPESLLAPSMAKFPRCKFIQGYGMTETSPAICMLPDYCHIAGDPHLRSIGKPVFWVQAKVVDPKTLEELPRRSVGEIVTKGPHVMKGYWKNETLTKETIVDGWLKTGDGGFMDEDGFIFLVDRLKDMIITGGENVYSAEVENCLSKFFLSTDSSQTPLFAFVAVIGIPDAKLGEKVAAFVVPKDLKLVDNVEFVGKVKEEVVKFCRERIGGYKVPREVFVRKELPVSGAGKILKNELRKEFNTDTLGKRTAKI